MNIVIAAEKTTIADLFAHYLERRVAPEDIEVRENPDETGSFLIAFEWDRYALLPNGEIRRFELRLED